MMKHNLEVKHINNNNNLYLNNKIHNTNQVLFLLLVNFFTFLIISILFNMHGIQVLFLFKISSLLIICAFYYLFLHFIFSMTQNIVLILVLIKITLLLILMGTISFFIYLEIYAHIALYTCLLHLPDIVQVNRYFDIKRLTEIMEEYCNVQGFVLDSSEIEEYCKDYGTVEELKIYLKEKNDSKALESENFFVHLVNKAFNYIANISAKEICVFGVVGVIAGIILCIFSKQTATDNLIHTIGIQFDSQIKLNDFNSVRYNDLSNKINTLIVQQNIFTEYSILLSKMFNQTVKLSSIDDHTKKVITEGLVKFFKQYNIDCNLGIHTESVIRSSASSFPGAGYRLGDI